MVGDDAIQRLKDGVVGLGGRVEPAGKFADLVARNQLHQHTPAAYVLPLGLRGGKADAVAGLFRQALDRVMGVVLVVRSAADQRGAKATAELEPLIDAVITLIAGWTPGGDESGVFRLARGELVSMAGGACTYQLDFILDDQLRITT